MRESGFGVPLVQERCLGLRPRDHRATARSHPTVIATSSPFALRRGNPAAPASLCYARPTVSYLSDTRCSGSPPAEKDAATATVEKRRWDAGDQFRANSGLKAAEEPADARAPSRPGLPTG